MRPFSAASIAAALAAVTLPLLFIGCSSVVSVPDASGPETTASGSLTHRIVVFVHGDASYLYHDSEGTALDADAEALRETFAAARSMPHAEVFVFHQRPRSRFLGLISRNDGTFYHFRAGRLLQQTTYEQDRKTTFGVEADLLRTHRAPVPDSALFTAALYYGHAVPERPRPGYHRSVPSVRFSMDGLARGLDRLHGPGTFDALVLSTCDGGTPSSIAAVAPHARAVLAAPGDLHLSFIDADLLSTVADATTVSTWTQQLADRAFERLTDRVMTAVTLAAYDVDRAGSTAARLAQKVAPDTSTTPTGARHVDCRQVVDGPVDTTGVRVWHRPARFGPQADRDSHSGWGCVPPTP